MYYENAVKSFNTSGTWSAIYKKVLMFFQ